MACSEDRFRLAAWCLAAGMTVLASGGYGRAAFAQQPGASTTAPQNDPNAPEARAERDLARLGEQATREQAVKGLDDAMRNVEDVEDAEGRVAPDDLRVADLEDAVRYYLRAHGQHRTPGELFELIELLYGLSRSDLGLGAAAGRDAFTQMMRDGQFGSVPYRLVFALHRLRELRRAAALKKGAAPTERTVSGRLHVRERATGDESLLATVTGGESPIGRVTFRLPSNYNLSLASAPLNWTLTQKGRDLTLAGPPVSRVDLRFDTRRGSGMIQRLMRQGEKVECGIADATGRQYKMTLTPSLLPKVSVVDSLDSALTVPPQVVPGAMLYATPALKFTSGTWRLLSPDGRLDFRHLPLMDLASSQPATTSQATVPSDVERSLTLALRYINRRPPAAAAAQPRLSYHDEWNEELVNGAAGWTEVPAQQCPLRLAGGTALAFAGQDACVAGCFPHFDTAAGFLTLDGERLLSPLAASPTTIRVRIPDDVMPGPHAIRWHPSTGITGEQVLVRVLQLQGSIAENELWKGQATTMRLGILGSDEPVQLTVVNETPDVIAVEGGARQLVTTSGGAVNVTTRQVRGIMRGNFNVTYSLNQPACGVSPR